MKHFLSAPDISVIDRLLTAASRYKTDPYCDALLGKGKRVGLVFFNPSLRTRLSTQVAAQQLGMEAIVLNVGAESWALEFEDAAVMNGQKVEHIKDAAAVLGSYFDILCLRTFPGLQDRELDYQEKVMQQFVRYAGIPVVSLESATLHPLQSLADVFTMKEVINAAGIVHRPRVVLTWAPHVKPVPQCVANSFAQWMQAWNAADFTIVQPQGYELAEACSGSATICYDQDTALANADFVYIKSWSSYQNYGTLETGVYDHWMLTESRLSVAPNAHIMHCLPVRRNVELSDELLDGSRSLVQQQAANRVWAAQAVLAEILKSG